MGSRRWGGIDWEFGVSRCKLLYIGWTNNKVLLFNTGNYIKYFVINHNGKEYDKVSVQFSCFSSVQFSSVTQSCPTLCEPMNCSTPGLPVHHQLPELTQTHVCQVSDSIQPSHPLSCPSPPAPNPSQHQSFPMSQLFA